MYIYKAILKHGHSNFSLEILEYCEPADVLEREQYYINLLKPVPRGSLRESLRGTQSSEVPGGTYNILKTAGSRFGNNHSEESNLKNRLSQSKRVKIEVTDLESNTVTQYNSIREAAAAIGKYHQAILSFFNMNKLPHILVDIFLKK